MTGKLTINKVQDSIIADFLMMGDDFGKFAYLIELSGSLPRMDESVKTSSNIVSGCQSRVWLKVSHQNGLLEIEADSDTLIVKGILAILMKTLHHRTPREIFAAELYVLERAGIVEMLSSDRKRGVSFVVEAIKKHAGRYV